MTGTSGAATLGADLDALMASFNGRITEIGNLMLVRSGGFFVSYSGCRIFVVLAFVSIAVVFCGGGSSGVARLSGSHSDDE